MSTRELGRLLTERINRSVTATEEELFLLRIDPGEVTVFGIFRKSVLREGEVINTGTNVSSQKIGCGLEGERYHASKILTRGICELHID